MQEFILYIDDTSFNQKEKNSPVLQQEQVTYAGILINKELELHLNNILNGLCNVLNQNYGVNEFHFTEIYNRKKPFENIQFSETLSLLDAFASIITEFDINIIPFTSRQNISQNQQSLINLIDFISPKLHMPEDPKTQALLIDILMAKKFTETKLKNSKLTKIVCDEGIRKNGAVETLNNTGLKIEFKSSSQCKLLQLADYTAWFLTRAKNILDKVSKNKTISETDRAVLEIYSTLSNNYVGLTKIALNLDKLDTFNYENFFDNTLK